jgi:hypothetical protein
VHEFRRLPLPTLIAVAALAAGCASSTSPMLHKMTVPETSRVLDAALAAVESGGDRVTLVLSSDLLPEIQQAAAGLRPVIKIAGEPRGRDLTLKAKQFRLEQVRVGSAAATVVGVLGPAEPPAPNQTSGCGSTYTIDLALQPDATWSMTGFMVTHC